MTPLRLGIDLGGTKIEIVAIDAQGALLLRERCATPQGDYAGTLRAVSALVARAEAQLGVSGVPLGMGIPGSLSPLTGRVRNANSTALNGQPLREDLQALLQRPIRFENDANCLALSEAADGAGAGAEVVFAAILGTGVGAGIAVRGRLLHGRNGVAGEWGHNPLPLASADEQARPACWCGRRACLESWLSGPALAADHLAATGQALRAEQIVARLREGDAVARASLYRYAARLARALAQIINVLDPDVIVLGGGMSNVTELYDEVPRLWTRHVFSDSVRTVLAPARHGDSSGVRGAAWLATA
ncbi:ROK family protein [Ottowia sp.]|uniref:ROK family protein n=1 Tax=Ottowia sp. TaxID=1898956 RepID=UPI002BFFA299|nr:ROK family protein [Ottowia sp.]HOB66476.1 ROK family protein [Ottowia sp.]HPZ58300.1 ROK family protein [Ottowia sp.]HQD47305.1 ROK family protein [Ottowia sp.]